MCEDCVFFICRVLHLHELDPLTLLIQETIDAKTGFDRSHIFFKLIHHGILSLKPTGHFEWPEDIVDFATSIEAQGSTKVCNLIHGPDMADKNFDKNLPWKTINVPFPSKSSRQRRKSPSVKQSGIITSQLRHFHHFTQVSEPLLSSAKLRITPVCIARDGMAFKPSGDLDLSSNTIVGLDIPIDLAYVKAHAYPDPDFIKSHLYTEAGAIVASTLDNTASLHVANDFLLSKTKGEQVYATVSNAIKA